MIRFEGLNTLGMGEIEENLKSRVYEQNVQQTNNSAAPQDSPTYQSANSSEVKEEETSQCSTDFEVDWSDDWQQRQRYIYVSGHEAKFIKAI